MRSNNLKQQVMDMYSEPRVTRVLKMGPDQKLIPGLALDLSTGWDFDVAEHRARARETIARDQLAFIIGSPPCTAYSAWHNINDKKRDAVSVQREKTRALVHMQFMCEVYQAQHAAGRYFLHEHPAWASSCDLECVQKSKACPESRRNSGASVSMGRPLLAESPSTSQRGSCRTAQPR